MGPKHFMFFLVSLSLTHNQNMKSNGIWHLNVLPRETSTESSTDGKEEDQKGCRTLVQQKRQVEEHEQKELEILLSNKEELKKKIHAVLKRTRKLVSIIGKSQAY